MTTLRSIGDLVGNSVSNLVQNNVPWKNPNAGQTVQPTAIPGVPSIWVSAVQKAAQHTGYDPTVLAKHFNSENGGKWDPELSGRADPTDRGITQLNPTAISTITGKTGGRNYFKDNYGHEFNPTNGEDQILASGVYLNWLKNNALPAAGVHNPQPAAVFTAYNTGAEGYAKNPNSPRARRYQELLANHDLTF